MLTVVCQGVYSITTKQTLLHWLAYRPLIGQCKCNATQRLSLISYMKESFIQAFTCFSIVSLSIFPHLCLMFSYLNMRSRKLRQKFEKALYFWFSVQIIWIFGLSLSSLSKSDIQESQMWQYLVKAFLISLTQWQKVQLWNISLLNFSSNKLLVDNSIFNPSFTLTQQ